MFTGLVETLGTVRSLERDATSARLLVATEDLADVVALGDSIAVDGCCVTVVSHGDGVLAFDLMLETLSTTTLGMLLPGRRVNLERALALGARLGGHLVQGHVDGIAVVRTREDLPGTRSLVLDVPVPLQRYVAPKGSLTLDGVSLTVAGIEEDGGVRVGLVPHTWSVTTLGDRVAGDRCNLEVDVLARYVERLLEPEAAR